MQLHKYLFLFILVISVSFIPFIGIYSIMSEGPSDLSVSLLINLPVCMFIGGVDFLFIRAMSSSSVRNNALRLIIDMVVTTLLCVCIITGLNFIFTDFTFTDLIKSGLPAIPWNWVATLLIELFFYNNRQQEVEREKAKYQLEALRNQINPHFLFNSLNVLASLAYTDGEKANLFTKRLSAVYRYLLSNNSNQTVPIGDELEFVNKYIYLIRARFGESVKVDISDLRNSSSGHIIPVSIQMLVENAIKHNVCTVQSPLKIRITIDDRHISVSNNLQLRSMSAKSGIGLRNIERQYALQNKSIAVSRTPSVFSVTLPVLNG